MILVGVAGVLGCGNGGGGGEFEIEIGTGTVDFEPVTDGDDLFLEAGPQGGHHFIVHATMRGLAPGDPTMPGLLSNPETRFAAFDSSGTQIDPMFPPYRLGYVELDNEPGKFRLMSGRILVIDETFVPALPGNTARITVSIRDENGNEASDEMTISVVERPAPDAGIPDAGPPDSSVPDAN